MNKCEDLKRIDDIFSDIKALYNIDSNSFEKIESFKKIVEKSEKIFEDFKIRNSEYAEKVEKFCNEVNGQKMCERNCEIFELTKVLKNEVEKIQKIGRELSFASKKLLLKEDKIEGNESSKRRKYNSRSPNIRGQLQSVVSLEIKLQKLLSKLEEGNRADILSLKNDFKELVREKSNIEDLKEKLVICGEEGKKYNEKVSKLRFKMKLSQKEFIAECYKFFKTAEKMEKFMKSEEFKKHFYENKK